MHINLGSFHQAPKCPGVTRWRVGFFCLTVQPAIQLWGFADNVMFTSSYCNNEQSNLQIRSSVINSYPLTIHIVCFLPISLLLLSLFHHTVSEAFHHRFPMHNISITPVALSRYCPSFIIHFSTSLTFDSRSTLFQLFPITLPFCPYFTIHFFTSLTLDSRKHSSSFDSGSPVLNKIQGV